MASEADQGTLDEAIRRVVTEHARLASRGELRDGDDLYRAGMTSHATVSVMLALEDLFGVEFPERMLQRSTFSSVASIRDALQELLRQN